MAVIQCYLNDKTWEILRNVSSETGRSIEDLAEAAIAEAAIQADRTKPNGH